MNFNGSAPTVFIDFRSETASEAVPAAFCVIATSIAATNGDTAMAEPMHGYMSAK